MRKKMSMIFGERCASALRMTIMTAAHQEKLTLEDA
jgi:hypothetical protein